MTIHLIRGLEGTGKTTLCKVLNSRGYAAINTDSYPGLAQWLDPVSGAPVPRQDVPIYVDEEWVRSHNFIWSREKMQELLQIYDGRQAFLCGSATNQEEFHPLLGLRFYLWASDGIVTTRLQDRSPSQWRYGSAELARRLQANQSARTEAILNGSIGIDAELPADQIATDVVAYVMAAKNAQGGR